MNVVVGVLFFIATASTAFGVAGEAAQRECLTPGGKEGECVRLTRCPPLMRRFQENPMTPSSATLLRQSNCNQTVTHTPYVCCEKLDFPMNTCGTAHEEDRIFGGTSAALGQHPWLVLVKMQYFDSKNTTKFSCGGALINKRYVLTAASCGSKEGKKKILFVRLGEHDYNNATDCQFQKQSKKEICTDKPVDYKVEQEIFHQNYSTSKFNYDILLIRLSEDVVYTEFIQPLCLPETAGSMPGKGSRFDVAGWGDRMFGENLSPVKQRVSVPFFDLIDCQKVYRTMDVAISPDHHMCAGGEVGKDACNGDSGGPLMRLVDHQGRSRWEVVGIVTFGPVICGESGVPGVYIKTNPFLPWIKERIRF